MKNNKQPKIGVYLARFQPLHNGHLKVINEALKECDKLVIILGSSNKFDMIRNPFNFKLRVKMLTESLNPEYLENIEIFELADWSQESIIKDNFIWGHYLYYNIVSRIKQKQFTIYYSDSPSIINSWFDNEVNKYITIRLLDRKNDYNGISSTKIRHALLENSNDSDIFLKEMLPPAVYKRKSELSDILVKICKKPKQDFTMK